MTTEIEKQFFDTFGIEPKLNRPCEQLLQNKYCNENSGTRDTYFDPYPYCVGFENCAKDYKERVWFYPKITYRILLELICIVLNVFETFEVYRIMDIDSLKEKILKLLMLAQDDVYSQVQALFEEG